MSEWVTVGRSTAQVRAEGVVHVRSGGRNDNLPTMTPNESMQLGELLEKAAVLAPLAVEVHQEYLRALEDAKTRRAAILQAGGAP